MSLSHENHTREDQNDKYQEGPLEVLCHETERQDAVKSTLAQLVLAVEAELAHVPIATHTVEQIYVPEDPLQPEIQSAYVPFT